MEEEKLEWEEIGNLNEPYIPVEFAWIDYQRSWKKCKCGRVVGLRDRYCNCGQKLGMPVFND